MIKRISDYQSFYSQITTLQNMILWKHRELGHLGVQALILKDYWILKFHKTINKVIKSCTIYQRFIAQPLTILEGTLPEDRVKDPASSPILKNQQKAWILIPTRAVLYITSF